MSPLDFQQCLMFQGNCEKTASTLGFSLQFQGTCQVGSGMRKRLSVASKRHAFRSHFLVFMGTLTASKALWRFEIVGVLKQTVYSWDGTTPCRGSDERLRTVGE